MTTVSARARRRPDRAGDPLDGLVNLFDIGIVLAVAFLLAGLAAVGASGKLGTKQPTGQAPVTVSPGDTVHTLPPRAARTIGNGEQIGRVYRLNDGRLIYVVPGSTTPGVIPSATPTPTPTR